MASQIPPFLLAARKLGANSPLAIFLHQLGETLPPGTVCSGAGLTRTTAGRGALDPDKAKSSSSVGAQVRNLWFSAFSFTFGSEQGKSIPYKEHACVHMDGSREKPIYQKEAAWWAQPGSTGITPVCAPPQCAP